jgi:uncharacterized membrane protein
MSDLNETIFGPLDKQYCVLFYFIAIFNFVFLVILLAASLWVGITKKKGFGFYLNAVAIASIYAIMYLQNRLLHSMCQGTLK